jgi:uncharacterized protein (DUF983 family)
MIRYEDFPEICIKCKRTDVSLKPFKLSKTRGLKNFRISYIKVPVCERCEREFNAYISFMKKTRNMFEIGFIILIFAWLFGILWVTGLNPIFIQVTFLVTAIIILLYSIVRYLISLSHPHRIKRFFNIRMDNTLYLKNSEYATKFEDYQNKMQVLEEQKIIYCPKCGNPNLEGKDYCNKCGRELRYIKIKKDDNL